MIIKVLSLTQPWATLVAIGAKTIETRSWRTNYTGWIAIHASKTLEWEYAKLATTQPFNRALKIAGLLMPSTWPLGAIIAIGNLHRVNEIGRAPDGRVCLRGTEQFVEGDELAFGDYTPGRFGWVITNVHPLPEPIPCKGTLGLWTPPPDVLERLEAFVNG